MGWTDSHLHQFEKDGKNWGVVQLFEDEKFDVLDDGSPFRVCGYRKEGALHYAGARDHFFLAFAFSFAS